MNKRFIASLLCVVCTIIIYVALMSGCSSSKRQSGSLDSNDSITRTEDSTAMPEIAVLETPMNMKDGNTVIVRSYGARNRLPFMVDEENRLWLWGSIFREEFDTTESSKPRVIMEDVADARVGYELIVILKTDGSVLYWDEMNDVNTMHEKREFAPEKIYEGAAKVRMDTSIPYIITPDGMLIEYYNHKLTEIMENVEDISSGTSSTLIITKDGELYVMGGNDYGQLGLGSKDYDMHREPVYVTSGVKRVAAGGSTSYFVNDDGTLYGCGINYQFQISESECEYVPEFVEIMDKVRDISASTHGLLILSEDNCLYMRGINDTCVDESIIGSDWAQAQNTKIADGVISVCAASDYGIMMKENGKLYSWGQNYRGDLGCGSEGYYAAPTEIKFGAK